MWQALFIQSRLREAYPGASVEIPRDDDPRRPDPAPDASKVGGKGLFVKELPTSRCSEGAADLAVHSLKDVPMVELPEGLSSPVSHRERSARFPFVSSKYASLDEMPAGARVGTASLRRELMLRMNYPHLEVLPVRGNVGTRLGKLDAGRFDAMVMASAGLKRLGLEKSASAPHPGRSELALSRSGRARH